MLDATVGQNGLVQAREFLSASGVNGIVLTKLDGTAKGGIAIAIAFELKLPIRYVGVGEGHRGPAAVRRRGLRRRAVHRQMVDVRDAGFIERAFFLGERGRGRTAPNPMVGAVIVSSRGIVVGQGAHLEAGGPHAEVDRPRCGRLGRS